MQDSLCIIVGRKKIKKKKKSICVTIRDNFHHMAQIMAFPKYCILYWSTVANARVRFKDFFPAFNTNHPHSLHKKKCSVEGETLFDVKWQAYRLRKFNLIQHSLKESF